MRGKKSLGTGLQVNNLKVHISVASALYTELLIVFLGIAGLEPWVCCVSQLSVTVMKCLN